MPVSDALRSDVNKAAVALAAMPPTDDLPRFLTQQLKEYADAVLVTYTEYDRAAKMLVPTCIEADSVMLQKSLDLIGKTLPEIRSPISDDVYKEIVSSGVGIRYSLHDVTFGAISKPVSAMLMRLTGIDRFYALAYVIEGELFGTSMIALRKEQPDPSLDYLESFAYLAAVSLRRMHADDERRKSEARFSAVFHRCPIGINVSRIRDGFIVDANDALLSVSEYGREELVGRTTADVGIWADHKDRSHFIEGVRKGFIRNFESRLRTKSGRILDVSVNAAVISQMGEEYLLSFIEDITERKRAEAERRKLEQQLFKAQRMESIGTLAGGIAHDFNNLLAMLLGNAELLKVKLGDDPALTKYIDRIIDASSRGASITKQLLLFSRESEIELQAIRLSDIVAEVRTMLVHFIPKSVRIHVEDEGGPNFINADPGLIHQVVLNLCLNAKDAMPEGGSLTLSERRLDASLLDEKFGGELSGPYIALSVSDTGVGIDDEHLAKIFDPFFTTKEKGKGTGLGLSIVHGIVKSHNGFIDVQSEKNKGTTFTLYFPAIAPLSHHALESKP
jgi:PAS domain S-box-containing protein